MRKPNPLELIRAKRLILETALNGPRVPGHAEICLELQEELNELLDFYRPRLLEHSLGIFHTTDVNQPVNLMRAKEIEVWTVDLFIPLS